MAKKYCIEPEMPYCPMCPFGGVVMEYDDDEVSWYCNCTKEKYDKYMEKYSDNDEGEWR